MQDHFQFDPHDLNNSDALLLVLWISGITFAGVLALVWHVVLA